MANKKQYTRPLVTKIDIDPLITLIMKSHVKPPKPRAGSAGKGADTPFQSPFGDKPFS